MATFWNRLFDPVDHNTRNAINEAAMEIRSAQSSRDGNQSTQLQKLFSLDRAQEREIERLGVCVQVLFEVVLGLGADEQLIRDRVEDALRAIETERNGPPQVMPSGGHPYRGGPPAAADEKPKPDPTTQCGTCGEEVLLRHTEFTAKGVVCDGCRW